MKKLLTLLFFLIMTPVYGSEVLQIGFTPSQSCKSMILNTINSCNESIDIAVYSWTDTDIMDLLLEKKYEISGKIRIIMDNQQAAGKSSVYKTLKKLKFEVIVDGNNKNGYMHNKFLVCDKKVVITGSYNWSANAMTKNDENCIKFIDDNQIFDRQFEKLWDKYKDIPQP